MRKAAASFVLMMLLLGAQAHAKNVIVTRETDVASMSNSKTMTQKKGKFEKTYVVEGDTITRTTLRDLQTNQITNDNTAYKITMLPNLLGKNSAVANKFIQAMAPKTSADSQDVIMIDKQSVYVIKTKGTDVSITTEKRIK